MKGNPKHQYQQPRLLPRVVVSRTNLTRSWVWHCLDCDAYSIVRPIRLEAEGLLDFGNRGKRAKRICERGAAEHYCVTER